MILELLTRLCELPEGEQRQVRGQLKATEVPNQIPVDYRPVGREGRGGEGRDECSLASGQKRSPVFHQLLLLQTADSVLCNHKLHLLPEDDRAQVGHDQRGAALSAEMGLEVVVGTGVTR